MGFGSDTDSPLYSFQPTRQAQVLRILFDALAVPTDRVTPPNAPHLLGASLETMGRLPDPLFRFIAANAVRCVRASRILHA
jgi:hypothetical protein